MVTRIDKQICRANGFCSGHSLFLAAFGRGRGHMSLSFVSLWGAKGEGGQATSICIPDHSCLFCCYQDHLGN